MRLCISLEWVFGSILLFKVCKHITCICFYMHDIFHNFKKTLMEFFYLPISQFVFLLFVFQNNLTNLLIQFYKMIGVSGLRFCNKKLYLRSSESKSLGVGPLNP